MAVQNRSYFFQFPYPKGTPCFVKMPFTLLWKPTRTASCAMLDEQSNEITVRVDGILARVEVDRLALPDSETYQRFLRDAEIARDEYFDQQNSAARQSDITVTAFLEELRGDLLFHQQDITSGQSESFSFITINNLQSVLNDYADEAKQRQEVGTFADNYHTFNELYQHRVRLFVCLMHAHVSNAWWSHKHHDGTQWDGWIIAGIKTPMGQATYHLPVSEIDNLPKGIEVGTAVEWDGHTADDVLTRLLSLNSQK